jgi:hypothetical protein
MTNSDDGSANFGMQPSGAASKDERPEGTSMTDRQQPTDKPVSQQELQMGQKAPMPGERAEAAKEQSGETSDQGAGR